MFLLIKIGRSDPYLFVLSLLLALHHLLFLLILYVFYLVSQYLNLLQAKIDLFAELVVQVFVYGRLLIVQHGFERFMRFYKGALRNCFFSTFRHGLFHIDFLWLFGLFHYVRHGYSTKWRFLFEYSLANVLIDEGLLPTGADRTLMQNI